MCSSYLTTTDQSTMRNKQACTHLVLACHDFHSALQQPFLPGSIHACVQAFAHMHGCACSGSSCITVIATSLLSRNIHYSIMITECAHTYQHACTRTRTCACARAPSYAPTHVRMCTCTCTCSIRIHTHKCRAHTHMHMRRCGWMDVA